MAQYQSFPDAAGDSRTLEKLKALNLPPLNGRTFLDVGCNEGFFCGYAHFDGASRSVGLDRSRGFIARARCRFPQCEFAERSWDQLPDGPFDVILLASALHYADDQPALVRALMSRLSPDGLLVLEMGIISSPEAKWVKVKRGIDERFFPSMPMVKELLRGYAWKWIGPSIAQDGDPVPRHVIHVARQRPTAYLLMQPPAYGKTTIAEGLFRRADIPVVSGDDVIQRVVKGMRAAPEELRALLEADYSPFRLDETIRKVFAAGKGRSLVQLWIEEAGPADFAVDAYVPSEWHDLVRSGLTDAGYMPVSLYWERAGTSMQSAEAITERADAYYASLADSASQGFDGMPSTYSGGARGFVDEVDMAADRLRVRGWAVDEDGKVPRYLSVRINGQTRMVDVFEHLLRHDVQKHLGLDHALCGYSFTIPLDPAASVGGLGAIEVRAGNDTERMGPALPIAGSLAKRLAGGRR
ncbi:hypothetical protein GCM10027084_01570 [Pseudoxanthomonas sangjuensis]|uniref:class I SAM-dependent methyltransferase n=1 Tax=Pseudoxanthomonas sangjuensis TaxID=1503750 RepID=UPI0013907948|nr:class I SAM-dependent methyltransferase [Pseudoxanthomonas sangjuensis]KAF1713947.1 hypothetical protein CSC71_06125 [Pseudoxanthomonas sangjuensis]